MSKTILIADDNDDLRALLAHQLQARGYRILMASDGAQAVEKCRSDKPDLVLLDVLMPGKDGAEASAELKEDPSTKNIPIIFLTALVRGAETDNPNPIPGERITLPKSVTVEDLIHKIEEALKK